MALIDEFYKNKIAEYLRTFCAARYVKEDNLPSEIEEGLYLGSVGVAYNKAALKAHNITHILVVAKLVEPAYPSEFTYKKVEVLDSPDVNLACHFEDCFNFIDQAKKTGGSVLVHCFAGRSRSVTILLAYLMKKHHVSLSQALDLVRRKRPQIAPNAGFMAQLVDFEKSSQVAKETDDSTNRQLTRHNAPQITRFSITSRHLLRCHRS